MSLLEGHADVVMDAVGPDVVPTRPRDPGAVRPTPARGRVRWTRIMRRLLGVEMKMRQYAEGAQFVRAVVAEVGMSGLNTVWTSPDRLPTGAEIRDPGRWLDRVAGVPPAVSA